MEEGKGGGGKIYGEVGGVGMSGDGDEVRGWEGEGVGGKVVMRNGLEDGEMKGEEVD